MNFDFLKGLNGLDAAYKPCTDAEELVKSKPYLSLIAARTLAAMIMNFKRFQLFSDTIILPYYHRLKDSDAHHMKTYSFPISFKYS